MNELRTALAQWPILPIIRRGTAGSALDTSRVLAEEGWPCVEVALTTPGAIEVIQTLRKEWPSLIVGAGTVLAVDLAERSIASGAQFLVAPDYSPHVGAWAHSQGIAYLPGVMTPTEVAQAVSSGFTVLKLFPAAHLGVNYMKAIGKVFPSVQFVATGGIGPKDARIWLDAGALAVGMGGSLTDGAIEDTRERAAFAKRELGA